MMAVFVLITELTGPYQRPSINKRLEFISQGGTVVPAKYSGTTFSTVEFKLH